MKKIDDENKQVLNLGSLHEEIEKEKAKKKLGGASIILIIVGIFLIILGLLFPKIKATIKQVQKLINKHEEKQLANQITCTGRIDKKEDIGITIKTETTYVFDNDLLKEMTVVKTYKVIEDSYDTGISNLSIYDKKYTEVEKKFAKVEGISPTHSLEDGILISTTKFNLSKVNADKIPDNDFIELSNQLNQTRKEIKSDEAKAGHYCN